MMLCQIQFLRHIFSTIIILLSIIACTHSPPPRVDNYGKPQRGYTYQAPEKSDDGWKVSSLAKEGVNEEIIFDLIQTILAGNYPNTHSVLLVKDGKLILEEYFYGNKRDDLHYLASATKSITSILIGISIDQGFLPDVDQNLSAWFADYQNTKWFSQPYDINIRHLLSMTAGIEWNENRSASDPKHDCYAMRRGGDWISWAINFYIKPAWSFCVRVREYGKRQNQYEQRFSCFIEPCKGDSLPEVRWDFGEADSFKTEAYGYKALVLKTIF